MKTIEELKHAVKRLPEDTEWWPHDLFTPEDHAALLAALDELSAFRAAREGWPAYLGPWPETGSVWRHKKRGTTYAVTGCGRQEPGWLPSVFYRDVEINATGADGSISRPIAEFMDGRFEFVPEVPASQAGEGEAK